MNEEFNKEFLKLSEKDQKAILNLIQLKNMNKKDEYKMRIDKAIELIEKIPEIPNNYLKFKINILLEILKGEDNE